MKQVFHTNAPRGFTLIELLIVIAVLAIAAVLFIPAPHSRPGAATTTWCMSNLRQIGAGLWIWSNDHNDQFPMQVAVTNGGSREFITRGSPALQFRTITNVVPAPNVWVCPTDKARHSPVPGQGLVDTNLSYFVSLDATPSLTNLQSVVLAGDRHLQLGGRPVTPGLLVLPRTGLDWTAELHGLKRRARGGNILFADAHVEFVRTNRLAGVMVRQSLATNRIAVP